MEDALLIHFIYAEKKSLVSSEHAEERIRHRVAAFKRRYGEDDWRLAKDEVTRIMAEDPQGLEPHVHDLIDGERRAAWFSQPHFEWLSRMTGFRISYILQLFQQDESIVARAALAADDPPLEAFYPGFDVSPSKPIDKISPTLFDSVAPNQLLDDYMNDNPKLHGLSPRTKAIARKVQQQKYSNGPPTSRPRPRRVGFPKQVNFEAGIGSRRDFEQLMADEFEQPPPRKAGDKSRRSFHRCMAGEFPPSPPRTAPKSILRRQIVGPKTALRRVSPMGAAKWEYVPSSLSQKSKPGRKRIVRR